MESDESKALTAARLHLEQVGYASAASRAAMAAVAEAERAYAASVGDQWAEEIDLGVQWDTGAPLPHVISNGSETTIFCFERDTPAAWNGSFAQEVRADDTGRFIRLTFYGCSSIMFGSPSDEVLQGHPLYGKGLQFYAAHKVHNSEWMRRLEAIQATHSSYRGPRERTESHYVLAFHDETFEAVAERIEVSLVEGNLAELLARAAAHIVLA